ncbi:MAG: hypothetical protein IJ785_04160 [Bacteroidales bacterium]|nr:hypothetical protein [Bacteroidales bacterium]
MKNIHYIVLSILFAIVLCPSAKAQFDDELKEIAKQKLVQQANNEALEETVSQPCWLPDNDEYFAASGFFRVKTGGNGERDYTIEFNRQLNSLRQQVKMKIGGHYRSIMRDYFDQLDVDSRSSVASHIESAGEEAIDKLLNDTKEVCRQKSKEVDEAGYVTWYLSMTVSKKEIAKSIIDGIENDKDIPENVKKEVRQNEEKFRETALKSFSELGQ